MTIILIGVSACGGDDSAQQSAASGPATTPLIESRNTDAATSTVVIYPAAPVALPGPGEAWDVAYVSDSTGFDAADVYTEMVSDELGVPVNLIDLAVGGQSIGSALLKVRANAEAVSQAEIVVVWGNPISSLDRVETIRCNSVAPDSKEPFAPYTAEELVPFTDDFMTVLDEVWKLRGGAPTVIIAYDLYRARVATLESAGLLELCDGFLELQSQAVERAAAASNASFVSLLDVFNGPAHDQNATDRGLLGPDDIHPSEQGARLIASSLLAAGLEPQAPPAGFTPGG